MNSANSAVLFDLDGVTVDTEPLYLHAEIRLFGEYGVEIPEKDWSLFKGCSEETFFNLSIKRYGITEERNTFIKKGRKYILEEFEKNISFIPGFQDLHKRINSSYKTGLVTASPRHSLDWIRNKIGLDEYFDHILSGDETTRNKPYPDPYIAMMDCLDIQPANSVIIEDSLFGIQSGLSSGGHVIAINDSVSKEELYIAHRIVNHLDEITIDMIEELLLENI